MRARNLTLKPSMIGMQPCAEPNPMHIYLKVSPTVDNGAYFQISVDRTAAIMTERNV